MNKLRQLYELNRQYFNATEPSTQHEILRCMAAMVSQLEKEFMFQLPDGCLLPMNGEEPERNPLPVKVGEKVQATCRRGVVYIGKLAECRPVEPDEWEVKIEMGCPDAYAYVTVTPDRIERFP